MIVSQFFGGTSLLILVGVLLDVMRQVEATLLQKNYDGFRDQPNEADVDGGDTEQLTSAEIAAKYADLDD